MKKYIFASTAIILCSIAIPLLLTSKQENKQLEVTATSDFIDISRYEEYATKVKSDGDTVKVDLHTVTSGTTSYALDNTIAVFKNMYEEKQNGNSSVETPTEVGDVGETLDINTSLGSSENLQGLMDKLNSIQTEAEKQGNTNNENNQTPTNGSDTTNQLGGEYNEIDFEEFLGL